MIDITSSDWMETKLASDQKECKKLLAPLKCPVHNRKARVICDYGNTGTAAHIVKCCCPEFAQKVLDVLLESQATDYVYIDDCEYTHV